MIVGFFVKFETLVRALFGGSTFFSKLTGVTGVFSGTMVLWTTVFDCSSTPTLTDLVGM